MFIAFINVHCNLNKTISAYPASILFEYILDCYRPNRNPVGPIMVWYRFKQNANWVVNLKQKEGNTLI